MKPEKALALFEQQTALWRALHEALEALGDPFVIPLYLADSEPDLMPGSYASLSFHAKTSFVLMLVRGLPPSIHVQAVRVGAEEILPGAGEGSFVINQRGVLVLPAALVTCAFRIQQQVTLILYNPTSEPLPLRNVVLEGRL